MNDINDDTTKQTGASKFDNMYEMIVQLKLKVDMIAQDHVAERADYTKLQLLLFGDTNVVGLLERIRKLENNNSSAAKFIWEILRIAISVIVGYLIAKSLNIP